MDPEDPAVYDMLCKADSVGVFQVESRAQMSMLPRLKPRTYYDLVVEVAIVRPGPIQGGMVHPYLKNREQGSRRDHLSRAKLKNILERTRGVPLFQEQAMQIAIDAAGFKPAKADKLRRAMATFRRAGTIHKLKDDFIEGMVGNDYERDFAERCFKQIEGFGEYGFPESHAASFAILVYDSSWVKYYYPEVFAAALLNSQPMGFYAPAQLVRDAREHDVEVRPPDVNASDWDCTLEPEPQQSLRPAPRLAPGHGPLRRRRQAHGRAPHRALSRSGRSVAAFRPHQAPDRGAGPRRCLRFAGTVASRRVVGGARLFRCPAAAARQPDEDARPRTGRHPARAHPGRAGGRRLRRRSRCRCAPIRWRCCGHASAERGVAPTEVLKNAKNDDFFTLAGLVLVRQRPGTASGVVFVTIEDECGIANLVVWPRVFDAHRRIVMGSRLLGVRGRVQREGLVIHLVAEQLWDWSAELDSIADIDDFHLARGRGDEVRTDPGDRRVRCRCPKPTPPAIAPAKARRPSRPTTAAASCSTGPRSRSPRAISTDLDPDQRRTS